MGLAALTALWTNIGSPTGFAYIGYGTNSTADSAGDTALGAQVARVAATITKESYLGPYDTLRFYGEHAYSSTDITVYEIGVFDAASGGSLLLRKVLDRGRPLSSGQTMLMLAYITFKDGGYSFTV